MSMKFMLMTTHTTQLSLVNLIIMEFLNKYDWQINLILTIFFLSRFLIAGYQWIHLIGTLIFLASFLQSYFKKNKQTKTYEKK